MSEVMAERYGTRRPVQRVVLTVLTVVLAVVSLAWLGWTAWHHSTPEVQAGMVSFHVNGERSVWATADVRVAEGSRGTCLLRATAADHVVVGELNAPVHRSGVQRFTIRTERRATSAEVVGCTPRS